MNHVVSFQLPVDVDLGQPRAGPTLSLCLHVPATTFSKGFSSRQSSQYQHPPNNLIRTPYRHSRITRSRSFWITRSRSFVVGSVFGGIAKCVRIPEH